MKMTWAEKWVDEHYSRGKLDGVRATLKSQIEHRLGSLSSTQQQKLDKIHDTETLDQLAKRLLDARSFADLGLDRD